MAKKRGMGAEKLSGWAFLIGVILAIVLGAIGSLNTTWLMVLVIIGLVVGLLNVGSKEARPFLLSGTVLIIASAFGQGVLGVVPGLEGIFEALLSIFVPATIIVAVRNAFNIARGM